MFLLALNELGLLPSNELAEQAMLVRSRVWGLCQSFGLKQSHKYTHTHYTRRMYTVNQVSSCSVSSLICCELRFFFNSSAEFCCWSLFVPSSLSSRLGSNLPLRLPPNGVHPPTPPPCLQEFGPHYRSLLHPNQPSHPAWSHSFSAALSHYLCRDSGEAEHYETSDTPPRLEGWGLLAKLTGD